MKTTLRIAAIIATFIIKSLNAQTLEPQELDISDTGYFGQYYWVDFNADGAYDILEVDASNGPVLHLSQNGLFVSIGIAIENLYLNEGRCAFNDYDGDGDIDILGSDQNSLVIVKYDQTNGFSLVNTGITYTDIEYANLYWLDIDGDLDFDIIHGQRIFLKTESKYTESRFSLPGSIFKMVFNDINNDGLVDIVAGYNYDSYDGSDVHILINQGEGHFNESGIALPVSNLMANSIAVIDADGDSDRDIFVEDRYARSFIFKNSLAESGTVSFTEKQISLNTGVSKALVGDMNSDGLQDLVVVNSQSFTVLKNTSSSGVISFEPASYEIQAEYLQSFAIIDFDQDNDLDVHVKGYSNEIDNRVFVNGGIPAGSGPSAPVNLTTVIERDILLSWNSTPGLLYNVEIRRNGAIYKTSATSPSGRLLLPWGNQLCANGELTIRGLSEGSYEWRVQALDPSGRSSPFSTMSAFTVGAAPSSLTLQVTDTGVKLCWSYNGPGTADFSIFRGIEKETVSEIAQVGAGINCFEDKTVPANESLTYFVVAVNGNAYSAPSNTITHHSSQFVEIPFGRTNPNIIATRCLPADYDMDGDYDLEFIGRVNNENNVLLKNNGDGSFTPAGAMLAGDSFRMPFYEMEGPRDLDNDGDPDLVLITGDSYSWQKISVFINNNGTFSKGFETSSYLGIAQLNVEDMNNDGRIDLMFSYTTGNSSGNAKQYKLLYQNSAGNFEDSKIIFTDKESSSYAFFKLADLNNDGFIDILWSYEENRKMEIFVNEGGMTFSKRTSTLPLSYLTGVTDYNGDGNVDVVVLGNEGLHMYFGAGDFTFPDPKVIPIGYVSSSPTFINADIDFNGWPDILLTDGYHSQVILNKGNGSFKTSDIKLKSNWGSSISITDFENDGDLDIVKPGNDDQHQGLNYFYKNQISDLNIINESPAPPTDLSGKYKSGKATYTWSASSDDRTPAKILTYNLSLKDGNGKTWLHPETDESGAFRRRLGPGNASQNTTKIINNLPAGVYIARVQAMDASFALSAWSPDFQFTIFEGPSALAIERILLNKIKLTWNSSAYSESAVIVERKSIETEWEVITELSAGSTSYVDADLEYNKLYQYRVFEASGDETTAMSNVAEWSTLMWVLEDTDKPNLFGSLDVADFTGDGRMDMLMNGGMIYNGYVEDITRATYENNSSGWIKNDITPSELPHSATTEFADLNGDNKPDIFMNGYIWDSGYKSEVFLNNGNKTFSPATNIFTDGSYNIESFFDFDMDNDLDINAIKQGSYPYVRQQFQNLGGGNYSAHSTTLCTQCPYVAAFVDFDGDGDEDVLRGGSNGYQIYLNTPDGLMSSSVNFPSYEAIPAVSDYNGDGLPDVVVLSSSHYYGGKIYKNLGVQGGSLKFMELPIQLSSGDPTLESADFNHDGLTDLAVISPNVTVLLNNGNDSFETYKVPSFRIGLHNSAIIDYDNDGDLDIFLGGYHISDNSTYGRKGKILLNQTIVGGKGIANLPPDVPSGLSSTQDSLGVHLSWNETHDDLTSPEGLTFDVVLLRDGKIITKGAHDPETGEGLRLVPGKATRMATFNNLLLGPYKWRVQAVDGSFARSGFVEGTFTFLPPPPLVRDTTIYRCGRTITLSATGTDIKWYRDKNRSQLLASGVFHPQESQIVYVTQTISGYEGISRRVKITLIDRPPVPNYSMQNPVTICGNSIGTTLWATGENLNWYSEAALVNLLGAGNELRVPASNAEYFVTQTITECQGTALKIVVEKIAIDAGLYYSDGKLWAKEKDADFYYWYRNGFSFGSSIESSIIVNDEPAIYSVAIYKGGCWEYSEPFSVPDDITVAAQKNLELEWSIYPNPANSHVTLILPQKNRVMINVIDTHGKSIYSDSFHEVGEQTIDISKWVKGVYLINVDDGKSISTRRFVIF